MAEPFSIVSASISLLDVSLRAIRETCKFISALRQASAELRYLHRHLAGLEKALIRSKTLKQSYSNSSLAPLHQSAFDDLDEELKLFVQDLARLKSLLGGPESSAEHAFNRFGKRVKSVFKEKELSKISGRLERRRLGISEILSSIGRHNDLETQVRLKAIQESQENLETDLKSNDTTTHLKLDAIVQTQRDTRRDQRQISQTLVQTVSSQTLSLSTITTRQEELKSTIVTGFSTACDHLSATRSDSTTSKGMIQQLSKHVSTNTDKLDRLAGLVESLNTLQLPSLGDQVIMNGSAQDAVTSLSLLSKHFEEIAAASLHQSPENVLPSSSGAGILVHNFRSLLAILHAQAYHEITSNKKQSNYAGRYRPSQPIALRKMLRNNPSYFRTIASVRNHKKRSKRREAVEIRETKISVDLGPIGRVTVFISENDPLLSNGSELGGFRVLFFPKAEVPVCGFAASFANNAPTPTMSPLLSTFGVLPPDHDIWRYIAGGHIDGVRDLLGDHRVHLNDRDNRDGDTLLGVRHRSLLTSNWLPSNMCNADIYIVCGILSPSRDHATTINRRR
ncbi:hypothetical protein BU16DRAFT_21410 [Lophium mytilinum]|uniref:Fungal N-terminal domain-containing protein n=1 Tax=Lophium mytilinum TaxID=390894 RepID=A0A6A6REL8_9PEZI|nr:hypothetical protein BU16DRAFT_21410 [Lophium mytilinum]